MTQKDKELLLKDLCARLPYGVKCYDSDNDVIFTLDDFDDISSGFPITNNGNACLAYIKPYLRPMSSMTDEEQNEFDHLRFRHDEEGWLDFVLSRHLDWRGLIEKGLALEAPEGMYNE